MLIGMMLIMILLKHPSMLCMCLVILCTFMGLYFKSYVSMHIYFVLIIFIGGILLLLFYLTMVNTNKPSWQSMIYLMIFITPDFYYMLNMKFNHLNSFLNIFNFKLLIILLIFMLTMILIIVNNLFSKINFMRQF